MDADKPLLEDPLAVNRRLAAVEASLRRHGAPTDYQVQDPGDGPRREPRIEEMGIAIRELMMYVKSIAERLNISVGDNVESYRIATSKALSAISQLQDADRGWKFTFDRLVESIRNQNDHTSR